jgi:hypothetical protein
VAPGPGFGGGCGVAPGRGCGFVCFGEFNVQEWPHDGQSTRDDVTGTAM